jgi:hypothetical protein
MAPAKRPRVREAAPVGPRVLAALTAGQSVEAISKRNKMPARRVEKILRDELRRVSIRPARDHAKLQIRRLESMVGILTEKAGAGELAAVDRLLRIMDRLDRHHSIAKKPAKLAPPEERDDEAFDRKLDELAARYDAEKREARRQIPARDD